MARWFAMGLAATLAVACTASGPVNPSGSGGQSTSTAGRAGAGSGSGGAVGSGGGLGGGVPGTGGASAASGGSSPPGSGGAGHGSGGTGGGSGGRGGSEGPGGAAGTGGAGGPGGAAGTAAGGDACRARAGLLFCEDFESRPSGTVASAPPWAPQIIGKGTLTVDATTAHRGGKSLHVHAGDDDYDTLLAFHDAAVLPAPTGRFYLRAYVRLGRAMAAGHNSYIVAESSAMPGAANNLRIGEDYAMLMYTVMGDAHGALSNENYYTDHQVGPAFAPSTWVCLEVLLDPGLPEIDFWLDGTEVLDLHHKDWSLDSYDTLRFGFEKYAGPGIDLWYDDIAISTARLGCD
jgi:polysaccharide lyase-like protein